MSTRLATLLTLAVAASACAGVLGFKPGPPSRPFEHRAHADAGVNCLSCHAGVRGAGDEGALHLPATTTCVGCHRRPHDARPCEGCHGEPTARAGAELARTHLRFEHKRHMRAVAGDCVRCHVEAGAEAPASLRPTMALCFGCHQHRDQWALRDCDGCHVDLGAERVLPTSHLVHEGDFLREHGVRAASARDLCASCHQERMCASCHGRTTPALPWRLSFDEPRLTGLHRAGFRSRHAEEARAQPGLCATCHTEASCQSCHEASGRAGDGARSPHPPGWLRPGRGGGMHGQQARIDPVSCASCHGGAGEQLCVDCHRVGGPGGTPHGPGFTSSRDKTGDVPCRFCHGVGP
ncbi:MAG: hypothetical protein MUF34_14670 [Polyangiaceae bacterium]|nr:hypothetical protein [Polyangiaceae bacterium]